jgi:hypothetical protein
MTSLGEIAATLPNGFHDAEVRSCSLDFQERTASFELNVWVGNMEASPEERELYRPAHPLVGALPKNSFAARFFVSNWNAFIHFAGREVHLAWTVPTP